ncbi:MAG: hypothetical protein KatS3mg103_0849 [Phycisphaerales bacterium]|nr:MAG: hypothetical protein KatS3mg103_0849 [Phycisphaerales bacterium]
MPRRGPSSPAAVDALAQLRRSPRRIVLRAIDRLELAIGRIDPDESVPAGWFLTTASGYPTHAPGRVPGRQAIADAVALVESLSRAIDLRPADLPAGFLTLADLAERWGLSERTVHRYRPLGLACRSVRSGRTRRLVFSPSVVEAFESRLGRRVSAARRFSRMDPAERTRAVRAVRELLDRGTGRTAAIRAVADELGRSPEAIRQAVGAQDGRDDRWPPRARRLALRAHDRFIEPSAIAQRLGREVGATRRMIDAGRLARLASLDLPPWPAAEPRTTVQPSQVPVGAPGARWLADLVAEMRQASAPNPASERAATAWARYLCARARGTLATVRPAALRAQPIDQAETDLLWAARLRVEALRPLLGLILRVVEARLGGPIESLPGRQAAELLLASIDAAARAAQRYDPDRGGRLSAAVSVAVDRSWNASHALAQRPGSARRSFASVPIEDWTRRVSPWQAFLEPPLALRLGLAELPDEQRGLLEARFGLGEQPHTLAQLSDRFGIHLPWVATRVRQAARRAIALGRQGLSNEPPRPAPDTIEP